MHGCFNEIFYRMIGHTKSTADEFLGTTLDSSQAPQIISTAQSTTVSLNDGRWVMAWRKLAEYVAQLAGDTSTPQHLESALAYNAMDEQTRFRNLLDRYQSECNLILSKHDVPWIDDMKDDVHVCPPRIPCLFDVGTRMKLIQHFQSQSGTTERVILVAGTNPIMMYGDSTMVQHGHLSQEHFDEILEVNVGNIDADDVRTEVSEYKAAMKGKSKLLQMIPLVEFVKMYGEEVQIVDYRTHSGGTTQSMLGPLREALTNCADRQGLDSCLGCTEPRFACLSLYINLHNDLLYKNYLPGMTPSEKKKLPWSTFDSAGKEVKKILDQCEKTIYVLAQQSACPVVCCGGSAELWGIVDPVDTHHFRVTVQRIFKKLHDASIPVFDASAMYQEGKLREMVSADGWHWTSTADVRRFLAQCIGTMVALGSLHHSLRMQRNYPILITHTTQNERMVAETYCRSHVCDSPDASVRLEDSNLFSSDQNVMFWRRTEQSSSLRATQGANEAQLYDDAENSVSNRGTSVTQQGIADIVRQEADQKRLVEFENTLANSFGISTIPKDAEQQLKRMKWSVGFEGDRGTTQISYDDEALDDVVVADNPPSVASSCTVSHTTQSWYDDNVISGIGATDTIADTIATAAAASASSSASPKNENLEPMAKQSTKQSKLMSMTPAVWYKNDCLHYERLNEPTELEASLKRFQECETKCFVFNYSGMVLRIEEYPTTDNVARYLLPRRDSLSLPVFNGGIQWTGMSVHGESFAEFENHEKWIVQDRTISVSKWGDVQSAYSTWKHENNESAIPHWVGDSKNPVHCATTGYALGPSDKLSEHSSFTRVLQETYQKFNDDVSEGKVSFEYQQSECPDVLGEMTDYWMFVGTPGLVGAYKALARAKTRLAHCTTDISIEFAQNSLYRIEFRFPSFCPLNESLMSRSIEDIKYVHSEAFDICYNPELTTDNKGMMLQFAYMTGDHGSPAARQGTTGNLGINVPCLKGYWQTVALRFIDTMTGEMTFDELRQYIAIGTTVRKTLWPNTQTT